MINGFQFNLQSKWKFNQQSHTHTHTHNTMSTVCLSVMLCTVVLRVSVSLGGWKLYCCVPSRALPIHFCRQFCSIIYHLATKHSDQLKSWQVSKADNGPQLYCTLYAVQSAITANDLSALLCLQLGTLCLLLSSTVTLSLYLNLG